MLGLFESHLPDAVALDVELEWAAHFRAVLASNGRAVGYAPT
ncbi:MAG TPA: hypothetical protein VL049_23590 [Candidatus Dormibacteraeota bacterium]|nr:hypothetical protein [Candidatus Dormibacteraeota bacterium]